MPRQPATVTPDDAPVSEAGGLRRWLPRRRAQTERPAPQPEPRHDTFAWAFGAPGDATGASRPAPVGEPATPAAPTPGDERFAWAFGPADDPAPAVGPPTEEGSARGVAKPSDKRFAWAFGATGAAQTTDDDAPIEAAPADDRRFAWAFGPAERNGAPDTQGDEAAPGGADDPPEDPPAREAADGAQGNAERTGLARWLPRRRPGTERGSSDSSPPPRPAEDAPSDPGEAETGPIRVPAPPAETEADRRAQVAEPATDGPSATDESTESSDTRRRARRRRRREPAPADSVQPNSPASNAAAESSASATDIARETNPARLRRRRKRLITDRELAVYHLGGLTFELYRRGMVSTKVLRHRAAVIASIDEAVHDIDRRLTEIDDARRERRPAPTGPIEVGCCLACRTPFTAEARFCWSCGARLHPTNADLDDRLTTMIRTARR